MKTIRFIAAAALLLAPTLVSAGTIKAEVKGMVCSFCAQGITTLFNEHEAIAKVTVSLTDSAVILEEAEGRTISDEEIKRIVRDSGFELVKIEREES